MPAGERLHHTGINDAERTWIGHIPVTSALRTVRECASLPILPDLLDQALVEAEPRTSWLFEADTADIALKGGHARNGRLPTRITMRGRHSL